MTNLKGTTISYSIDKCYSIYLKQLRNNQDNSKSDSKTPFGILSYLDHSMIVKM